MNDVLIRPVNRYNKYNWADLFCFQGDLTTLNPANKVSLNKFCLSECFTPLLQFTGQWFRFAPRNKRPIFHYICISWMLPETATRDKQRHTNKWWDRRSPRRHDEIAEINPRIWSPRVRFQWCIATDFLQSGSKENLLLVQEMKPWNSFSKDS